MTLRSRLTLTALALAVASALAPMAHASGFQLREQSPSAQGNAFAGISAGGSDLSALFFNPAVMTQYDGKQFTFGGTYVNLKAEFSGGTATRTATLLGLGFQVAPVTGASLNTISGPSTHPNAAISAVLPEFNIMYSVSKDLKLGLSVNVPFGLTTEYDANWIGRYHALKSELKTIDVSPSLAYRVHESFTLGVAFVARKADAELSNGVDFGTALALKVGGGLAAAGISTVSPGAGQNSPVANIAMGAPNATLGTPGYATPGAWDGTAGLKGGAWGYGYKVGAIFHPNPAFRLGIAYSGAMSMTLTGDAAFKYPTSMPASDLTALQAAGLRNGGGSAELNLPATASLGFDYQVNSGFSFQGEVARSTWSKFKELRVKFDTGAPDSVVDENWNDTTYIAIGGTWKLNEAWVLRAGLATDQSATDDAHRTPRIPDNDRKWVSFGMSYRYSKKATIDFGYTRIFVAEGKMMLTAGTTSADPNLTRGNLNGSFTSAINILGTQIRYTF